mmetsp:Transcript_30639/g.74646  ORF Transcript_30639/g.74646 Transcript_30639/m.74646 type:complete len:391 (+) Transcript_30639:63-1235(+)
MALRITARIDATFVSDVSVPDGQGVYAGSRIQKIWRMKNIGDVGWPRGTKVIALPSSTFANGVEERLNVNAHPGETCDVQLSLPAPKKPGNYVAKFSLATAQKKTFGSPFWVKVSVLPPEYVPDAKFKADLTIPDGAYVFPGELVKKKWLLSNPYGAKKPWPEGVQVLEISQHRKGKDIDLKGGRAPGSKIQQRNGSEYVVMTNFSVPKGMKEGKIRQKYQLATAEGKRFGHVLWIEVEVKDSIPPFPGMKVVKKPADVTEADAGTSIGTYHYRLENTSNRAWPKFKVHIPPSLFLSSQAGKGEFEAHDREYGSVKAKESIEFSYQLPVAPGVTCKFEYVSFIRSCCGKYLSDLPTTVVSVHAPLVGKEQKGVFVQTIDDEDDDVVHIDI